MSASLLSVLFLLLSALMAAVVLGLFSRYLEGRSRLIASVVFIAWLAYVDILGQRGIVASKTPPGPALLLVPVIVFLFAFLLRNPGVKEFALQIPVALLISIQVFRVFVELALFELYRLQLVPRIMTFEGGNIDILIGLSAPVIAWLYASRRMSATGVKIWCGIGIFVLMNIVLRTLLTFAGVIKTEIPNAASGMFPFTFLPGFLAPLALYLHVLTLRALPSNNRKSVSAFWAWP